MRSIYYLQYKLILLQLVVGRYSFNRRSLHALGNAPNPYEQAISIIGQTLSPFDEDNLIPCYGFGDGNFCSRYFLVFFKAWYEIIYFGTYQDAFPVLASTHAKSVFSFYPDNRPCRGFEEALARYREIVPHLNLSGHIIYLMFSWLLTSESQIIVDDLVFGHFLFFFMDHIL